MGIAAEHANPIESIVANVIPTAGGVLFFGCHNALCVIVWTLVRVQQTCFAHSGYVFNNHILDTLGIAHSEVCDLPILSYSTLLLLLLCCHLSLLL